MSEKQLPISSAIMHAPAYGSTETQIGGAEEAAREFAYWLYQQQNLQGFATVRYKGINHRFNPGDYIPEAHLMFAGIDSNLRGDTLLTNVETLEALKKAISRAADGSQVMFTHYYIASGAWQDTNKATEIPEIFFAHTWAESTAINNPARKAPSALRTEIETKNAHRIANGQMLLAIQTRAEAEQLLDLYGIQNQHERAAFIERTIITPLGVPKSYLDIGTLQLEAPHNKEQLKQLARTGLINHLQKTGKGAEAARLAVTPESNKWMYVIGRLEDGKGHEEALSGFIDALQKEPALDASLLLVGGDLEDNPIYHKLLQKISELPEEAQQKILLLGNQVDTDIIPACDIGIVASRRESFSFVGAKTMATGNALLVNHDPIIMEAMGMKDACATQPVTFNPDNSDELGNAMIRIIVDDQFRLAQGQRNAHYAKNLSWDVVAQNFVTQVEQKLPLVR